MIPVYQTMTVANDDEGNCFNACVASIMEMPLRDVCDVLPRYPGNYWGKWDAWFKERGLKLNMHGLSPGPPKGYAIATGTGGRLYPEGHERAGCEILHAAVVFNGQLVHDPYPGADGFADIRYYWTIDPREPEDDEDQ